MLNPFKYFSNTQALHAEISALKSREKALSITAQALINPLTGIDEEVNGYYGAKYKTYDSQVAELAKKYANTAEWGSLVMKNIIDVRAAFIVGTGVVARVRDGFTGDAERELEFIRRFVRMNDIAGKKPQMWGTEAEIEGKVLLRLTPQYDPIDGLGNILITHTPWRKYQYAVTADEPNFDRFIRATYEGTVSGTSFSLPEPYFVYARFGGNPYDVDVTPPKASFVLRHVEDLDKELWDWRKLNHLFAAPTPWFNCEEADEARRLTDYITQKNWRMGKALVTSGTTFELVCANGDGAESIRKAIESDVQVISGTTGVPVHFLGHPELLSNRSTADTLLQLIELSTDKERDTWKAAYTSLFRKGVVLYNAVFNNNLNPDAVVADLPSSSSATLTYIQTVYLPMYLAGTLSLETLLTHLSDIDVPQEVQRVRKMQAEKEAREDKQFAEKNRNVDKGRSTSNGG